MAGGLLSAHEHLVRRCVESDRKVCRERPKGKEKSASRSRLRHAGCAWKVHDGLSTTLGGASRPIPADQHGRPRMAAWRDCGLCGGVAADWLSLIRPARCLGMSSPSSR